MDLFIAALVLGVMGWSIKSRTERERVQRLALHLQPYDIEKLMQTLSEGYVRALGESDAQRRLAIWHLLVPAERKLAEQFQRLAHDFGQLPPEQARIIALPLPWLADFPARLWPQLLARHSVDMRELLRQHLQPVHLFDDARMGPRETRQRLVAETIGDRAVIGGCVHGGLQDRAPGRPIRGPTSCDPFSTPPRAGA